MVSQVIKHRAKAFFESLDGLRKSEIVDKSRKEVSTIKDKYALSTARKVFTYYRQVSEEMGLNLNRVFRLKSSENKRIEKKYNKKLANNHKQLKPIKNIGGMIEKAKDLLDSDRYSDIVCALCLFTGRRPTEILKTAKFTNVKGVNNKVLFEGQLKKRGLGAPYEIYTIFTTAKDVKLALAKVRDLEDTSELANYQVSQRYGTTINARVMKHFKQFIGSCSAKSLRKIYGIICEQKYKPPSMTTNAFLASILGHETDDITTANSYQSYYIK